MGRRLAVVEGSITASHFVLNDVSAAALRWHRANGRPDLTAITQQQAEVKAIVDAQFDGTVPDGATLVGMQIRTGDAQHQVPSVPGVWGAGVSVCRCLGVSMCRCVGVSECRCVGVSVCRWTRIPWTVQVYERSYDAVVRHGAAVYRISALFATQARVRSRSPTVSCPRATRPYSSTAFESWRSGKKAPTGEVAMRWRILLLRCLGSHCNLVFVRWWSRVFLASDTPRVLKRAREELADVYVTHVNTREMV